MVVRVFSRHPLRAFVVGIAVGVLLTQVFSAVRVRLMPFKQTRPPRSLLSLPQRGVSHAPDVLKRVLAARDELPHVTQVGAALRRERSVCLTRKIDCAGVAETRTNGVGELVRIVE